MLILTANRAGHGVVRLLFPDIFAQKIGVLRFIINRGRPGVVAFCAPMGPPKLRWRREAGMQAGRQAGRQTGRQACIRAIFQA
jgi:hypothetical protein